MLSCREISDPVASCNTCPHCSGTANPSGYWLTPFESPKSRVPTKTYTTGERLVRCPLLPKKGKRATAQLMLADRILLAEMVKEHMHRFRTSEAIVSRDEELLKKLLPVGKVVEGEEK